MPSKDLGRALKHLQNLSELLTLRHRHPLKAKESILLQLPSSPLRPKNAAAKPSPDDSSQKPLGISRDLAAGPGSENATPEDF